MSLNTVKTIPQRCHNPPAHPPHLETGLSHPACKNVCLWPGLVCFCGCTGGRTPTQHCSSVYSMCRVGLKVDPPSGNIGVLMAQKQLCTVRKHRRLSGMASLRASGTLRRFQKRLSAALGASAVNFVANTKS